MATDTNGEGLTEASEGYTRTLAWNSRGYMPFSLSTLLHLALPWVVQLWVHWKQVCWCWRELEVRQEQRPSWTWKYKSTSLSLVDQARTISPAPISPAPNFQRGREIGPVHATEIHLAHWLDLDWLQGMLTSLFHKMFSFLHALDLQSGRE